MSDSERTATGKRSKRLRVEQELGRRLGPHAVSAAPVRSDDLCLCPACGRKLVYPLEWGPAGPQTWRVDRRCPDCEWHGSGAYGQEIVDRFDDALDAGTEAVLDDLERLTRANLEERIDHFADALNRGRILPEDF